MYEWLRTPYTFTIDPNVPPVVGAEYQLSPPLVGYTSDFQVVAKKQYSVADSVQTYLWRYEDTMISGVSNAVGYTSLIEVRFSRTFDQGSVTSELMENRFGTAKYDPVTGELEQEAFGDWEFYSYNSYPGSAPPASFITLYPPASQVAGTFEQYVRVFADGVEQGAPELVGKYDMRSLYIENLRAKCPFDPLEGPGTIEFDVVAYPEPSAQAVVPQGWAPLSPITWEMVARRSYFGGAVLWNPSGSQNVISGAPEPNGRVAHVAIPWDGTDENGDFLSEEVTMSALTLSELAEPGNFLSRQANVVTLYHRQCPCEGHQSEVSLGIDLPMFSSGALENLSLSYKSLNFCATPNSLGYGWSCLGSVKISEPEPGVLILRQENGIIKRWYEDNGVYLPVRDDNYDQVEKNSASSDAKFVVTFQDQTVYEFQADGRIKKMLDRNGNSLSYTYLGDQLASVSDNKGHVLYYSYGDRTDGQPRQIVMGEPANSRVVELEYYAADHLVSPGRLFRVTDPEGKSIEFTYDGRGRLCKYSDIRPSYGDLEVHYQYSSNDRLYKETVYDTLERVHDRSNNITINGLKAFITTTPLDSEGQALPNEERNEVFVRDPMGRVVIHYLNYLESFAT